jgi:hypothetical protein
MVGIIEDTGVDGNDRGPIQSADDIDRPMQDAAMTVDFSQNSRPAAASTDSAGALNRNCLDFLFPAMLVARPSAFSRHWCRPENHGFARGAQVALPRSKRLRLRQKIQKD